jgi:hypothetical protein
MRGNAVFSAARLPPKRVSSETVHAKMSCSNIACIRRYRGSSNGSLARSRRPALKRVRRNGLPAQITSCLCLFL